jgi:2'-5' RNA ligase
LKEVKPFKISICELEGVDNYGYYLFLNIDDGKNNIRELHYKFHKGILYPYQSEWTKDGSFVPHITVGRFENKADMTTALNETIDFKDIYSTIVDILYC